MLCRLHFTLCQLSLLTGFDKFRFSVISLLRQFVYNALLLFNLTAQKGIALHVVKRGLFPGKVYIVLVEQFAPMLFVSLGKFQLLLDLHQSLIRAAIMLFLAAVDFLLLPVPLGLFSLSLGKPQKLTLLLNALPDLFVALLSLLGLFSSLPVLLGLDALKLSLLAFRIRGFNKRRSAPDAEDD
jgi:hypothetical protein